VERFLERNNDIDRKMFENKDYISLSLSDDSVRSKSFKRVIAFENFHVKINDLLYYNGTTNN
jgi:hypothetical protein